MDIRQSNGKLRTEFSDAELLELTPKQRVLFDTLDSAIKTHAAAEANARDVVEQLNLAKSGRQKYMARFANAFRVTPRDAWLAARDTWRTDHARH
jgi:hypothetical protein